MSARLGPYSTLKNRFIPEFLVRELFVILSSFVIENSSFWFSEVGCLQVLRRRTELLHTQRSYKTKIVAPASRRCERKHFIHSTGETPGPPGISATLSFGCTVTRVEIPNSEPTVMEHWNWQTFVAIGCVACAVVFLTRRVVHFCRARSGCGPDGCGSCSSTTITPQNGRQKAFVSLESISSPSEENRDQ